MIGPTIRSGYDSFWFGHNFAIVLKNPEDIQIAMNSELCFEKHPTYEFYFKYGMLSIGGEKYKLQRKFLNPLFTPSNVRNIMPIINTEVSGFLNTYSNFMESQPLDMRLLAGKFTLKATMQTFIGLTDFTFSDEELNQLLHAADEFMVSASGRIFKPWIYPDFIYRFTEEYRKKKTHMGYITSKVGEINEIINKKPIQGITFHNCMKEIFDTMDDLEYQETTSLFMGAAYETTAGTISAALLLLGINPEKQENLFNEVSSVLSSYQDEVTSEKINQMPYLDLVIKETLRLLPNNIFITRNSAKDVQFSEFTLYTLFMIILIFIPQFFLIS